MGKKSRTKREQRTLKDRIKQKTAQIRRKHSLQGTRIPAGISVIEEMRKSVRSNPAYRETLRLLEETVEHFEVPAETKEQAMEAIQRFSMLVVANKGMTLAPLSEDPSEDEVATHKLADMVEYFHSIAQGPLEKLNPIRN